MGCVVLGWVGLCWLGCVGFVVICWVGLGRVWLGCMLCCVGLGFVGLCVVGLG